MKLDSNRLLRSIDELSEIGGTSEGGITRLALSSGEIEAKMYIVNLMKKSGLETHVDPVGNVTGYLRHGSRVVASGSHVDTVINGGRLDGSYGVLAAIEALRAIKENNVPLSHSLAAVSFTNEEGVRFPAMTGSKYIAGVLPMEDAYQLRDWQGMTFGQALRQSKLPIENDLPIQFRNDSLESFVELHIEQGPILEQKGFDIGVVENIVGIVQYEVTFQGSADHAGTTPMNMRSDALLAASRVVSDANKLAKEIGGGAVATVGRIEISPNVPNVVPGNAVITVEFRHKSAETVDQAKRTIAELVQMASDETGVKNSMRKRTEMRPTDMSPRIIGAIEGCVGALGLHSLRMQSGAGHDTMMMRKLGETGMIFVPSKAGKSHNPLEASNPEDLINGATVLAETLLRLAQ